MTLPYSRWYAKLQFIHNYFNLQTQKMLLKWYYQKYTGGKP